MKRILFSLLAMVALLACSESTEYTLKGTILGEVKEDVYLKKFSPEGWIDVDTAQVVDGEFEMTGSLGDPELHMLVIGKRKVVSNIFLENSKVTLAANTDSIDANGMMKDVKIEGSKSHETFTVFFEELKKLQEKVVRLNAEYRQAQASSNENKMNEVKIDFDASVENMNVFVRNFAKNHTDSPVSAFVIMVQQNGTVPMETLKELVKEWEAKIPNSTYVKLISKKVKAEMSTAVGAEAPDFELNTPDGQPLKLSSLRGKYILIDFWASWCGPCRRENPNVVNLYNQYKDKGFDILGVSLDTDKAKWLQAIEKDGLTWNHVSDLKKWQSDPVQIYKVRSIPHTILLDKDGKIIAKNLRGKALEDKLAELMN